MIFIFYTTLATLYEPHSYREASSILLWQAAMTEEFDALFKNCTWDLVDLSPNKSMVGCKWVFKIKTCLVTKGFTQKYGIDYEETFSLIGHLSFVCTLMAITASY